MKMTIKEVIEKYKTSRTKLYYLKLAKILIPEVKIENGRTKHYYNSEDVEKIYQKDIKS